MRSYSLLLALACASLFGQVPERKIQTLLITGGPVGGHDWRTVSPLLKQALEATGRFEVRVTEEFRGAGAETLAPYDLVVLNYYDGRLPEYQWPARTQQALLDFVKSGKGLVVFHFSTAAFLEWAEFEKLSGGNWRPNNGHHSPAHDFEVVIKDKDHPITRGLAEKLPVVNDELYANLKWQPAGSFQVLATAYDDHKLYAGKAKQPTPGEGLDHPMLWVLNYGKGRVFTTALGHDGPAVKAPTFVETFARGAEWAATGAVAARPAPAAKAEPKAVWPGVIPADATGLFNGRTVDGWVKKDGTPSGCTVVQGLLTCRTGSGDAYTAAKIGSAQIHLEVQIPNMPDQKGQLKGNSGIYLQGLTEIQVLDSYRNPTYADGTIGAVYAQYAPLVNAARTPGDWAVYDILYHRPQCDARGGELAPARLTLLLNGVLVQDHVALQFKKGMCDPGPLMLQDHSGFPGAPDTTMRFRNLWFRPLD